MSIYDDAMPELGPGNTAEVVRDGHVMHITATRGTGFHSGRRRYMVECLTCRETIHEATTGPMSLVGFHLREVKRLAPPPSTPAPSTTPPR